MPVKTALFLLVFVACAAGATFHPVLGVLGYVAHYCLGPERQWWAAPLAQWGMRFSYTLAIVTAVGIIVRHRDLGFGKPLLRRQEVLLLVFLGVVWLSALIGEATEGFYTIVDHPTLKMTKVVIFTLMLTHVVTTRRHWDWLMWTLVAGALVLGWQAYTTPLSQFAKGRLETVGGVDFREANFLPAYLGAMLPIIGVQFLRSGWMGKAVCLAAGVFATNAIVLTRSRGAVVGIAAGALAALVLAPRRHRAKVAVALVVAVLGGLYLADPAFLSRAGTITRPEEQRDYSAQSRIIIWEGSLRLWADHPLGVGAGNFFQAIGRYTPVEKGADAHSIFVRCYSELGVQGILMLLILIGNALVTLRRVSGDAARLPEPHREHMTYAAFGLSVSIVTLVACSLTISLLYVEALWWLLAMPVCLERAMANLQAEALPALSVAESPSRAKRPAPPPRRLQEAGSPA